MSRVTFGFQTAPEYNTRQTGHIIRKCSAALLMFGLLSGCVCWDNLVSPGRMDRDQIAAKVAYLEKGVCEGVACEKELKIIGHGAASYRHYPMDITSSGRVRGNAWNSDHPTFAKPISSLMDTAFASEDIDAIEIDLQAAPEGHPMCRPDDCVYIMHNQIRWPLLRGEKRPEAIQYLNNNSLNRVLDHYVEKGYFAEGKRLYLELKADRGCANPGREGNCKYLGKKVASQIAARLKKVPDGSISFISFSATALKSVHDAIPENESGEKRFGYALILGIDHPFPKNLLYWIIAQAKGPVPMFSNELKQFTEQTVWLDEIWFSNQGVADFGKLLNAIDEARKANSLPTPLKINVAAYPQKHAKFIKSMINVGTRLENPLSSFMIDVEDDIPAEQLLTID